MALSDQPKCKLSDPIVEFQHCPKQYHPSTGDGMKDYISDFSRQTPDHPPASSLHELHLGSDGDVDNALNDGETPDNKEADSLLHVDVHQALNDIHEVPFSLMTRCHIQKTDQGIQKASQGTKFAPKPSLHDLRIGSEGDVNLKDDIELDGKKYRLVTP